MKYTKVRMDFHALLGQESYLQVVRDLRDYRGEAYTIDNYFFDTEDRQLFYKNIMLRLRHYTEKNYNLSMIVPLKEHLTENLIISPLCIEGRNKLFCTESIIIDQDFEKEIQTTVNKPVSYIGKVLTKRFIFQYFGSVVKIDHNFYPGDLMDYEIEFGVFDEKKSKEVEEIFYFFKNTYSTEVPKFNKYQRFIGNLELAGC